jgi:hypothetical protein
MFVRSLPVFGRGLGIWLVYLFVPSICEEVSPTVEFLKLFFFVIDALDE